MTVPKRYPRGAQVHPVIRQLITEGAIRGAPRQVDRGELSSSDGVDIIFDLMRMTPDRFGRYVDQLLVAASYECSRYSEFDYFFAEWQVRLNTSGGRRAQENDRRYTAAMSADPDTMLWGDGRENPVELGGRGRSLSHKAEAIINMNQTGSPGSYVNQQNPFRVTNLVISVRIRSGVGLGPGVREAGDVGFTRVTRPNAG